VINGTGGLSDLVLTQGIDAGLLDPFIYDNPQLLRAKNDILAAISLIVTTVRQGGKLLVCGNGGSASDAEHIVAELMKSFKLNRNIPREFLDQLENHFGTKGRNIGLLLQEAIPAISLPSCTSLLTAIGNDTNQDMIYAQQVYGYGEKGDLLIAITTSGKSPNIINAAMIAKAKGMYVLSLTGANVGTLLACSDICLKMPSEETFRIQEFHIQVYHQICLWVEQILFQEEKGGV